MKQWTLKYEAAAAAVADIDGAGNDGSTMKKQEFSIIGNWSNITHIAGGTSEIGRIGRRVLLLGLEISGEIHAEGAGALADQNLRFMIVRKNKQEAQALVLADLLDNSLGGADSVYAFPNTKHSGDYTILMDRHIHMPRRSTVAALTATDAENHVAVNTTKVMRSYTTFYNDSAGTFDKVESGGLWLLTLGQVAHGDASLYVFTGRARIRFIDA